MQIDIIDENLKCINLENFINTWIYSDRDLTFLVDPGPTVFIDSLKKSLNTLNIGKTDLNYILLTHPHIDHAGGVGKLLESFPQANVICHPYGIKHLINPKKLWEASLKVLGREAELYGKIEPVPEDRISYMEEIEDGAIKVIETLGHSPHHQSYYFKNILFIGEACGHHYPSDITIYIRPATPPIFDYDKYISSLQNLLNHDLDNYKICFPHWGIRDNAAKIIKIAYTQIMTWLKIIESLYDKRYEPNFMNLFLEELDKADPIFSHLKLLDKEVQTRETFVLRQSVSGIMGYIENKRRKKSIELN